MLNCVKYYWILTGFFLVVAVRIVYSEDVIIATIQKTTGRLSTNPIKIPDEDIQVTRVKNRGDLWKVTSTSDRSTVEEREVTLKDNKKTTSRGPTESKEEEASSKYAGRTNGKEKELGKVTTGISKDKRDTNAKDMEINKRTPREKGGDVGLGIEGRTLQKEGISIKETELDKREGNGENEKTYKNEKETGDKTEDSKVTDEVENAEESNIIEVESKPVDGEATEGKPETVGSTVIINKETTVNEGSTVVINKKTTDTIVNEVTTEALDKDAITDELTTNNDVTTVNEVTTEALDKDAITDELTTNDDVTTVNEVTTEALDKDAITDELPTYDDDVLTNNGMYNEERKLNDGGNSSSPEQPPTESATLVPVPDIPHYAKLGQFPWVVVFRASVLNNYNNGDPLCVGSLVDTMWVLTVAHCFQPDDDPSSYTVFAGIIDVPAAAGMQQEITKFYQERKVSKIIIHPRFIYGELKRFQVLDSPNGIIDVEKDIYLYDVAILRLQAPFSDDTQVIIRPLILSSSVASLDEALCTIVSWERFQDESKPVKTQVEMRLQWKKVTVERPEVCKNQYKLDIPNIVCLGSNVVNRTCYGPGGSPLVCISPSKSRTAELVGMSLWIKTSVGCTNITPQYLWIRSHERWLEKVMSYTDSPLPLPSYPKRPVKPPLRRDLNLTSRVSVDRALMLAVLVCVVHYISWAEVLGLVRCLYDSGSV